MTKEIIICPQCNKKELSFKKPTKIYSCDECNISFKIRPCPFCKKKIFQPQQNKEKIHFCPVCREKHPINNHWHHFTPFCQIDLAKKYPEEIINLVLKPLDLRFYLEAMGQMDAIIDEKLYRLFDHWTTYDAVGGLLKKKVTGRTISEVLCGLDVISNNIKNKIGKFKEIRNELIHEKHGGFSLVIKKKLINLEGIKTKEILDKDNFELTYKAIVEQAISSAIEVYQFLLSIMDKYPPPIPSAEQINKEIDEVYKKNK